MHVAYGRGSVLLQQSDEIPMRRGNFGGFLPHWQCIVRHGIWDPYKDGWTDRDVVLDDDWVWPEEHCVTWGEMVTIPEGEGAILMENVPNKPSTLMNCQLDWSMQRYAHDRGRHLIASVGRVYYWPQKGIAHRGRRLISTIALLLNAKYFSSNLLLLVFRLTLWQCWPNKAGLKCQSAHPYVRTYIRPSTKSFFGFNEIWHVGRGRWVMHNCMQYDLIQDQGHKPFKVGNLAIFKSYLRHLQWELATDHGFLV